MKLNLNFLGTFRSLAKDIAIKRQPEKLIQDYNDVVDHALKMYLSEEEFDTVVNGYRRSDWSEEALLHGLNKMDQPEHEVPKDEHYYKALDKIKQIMTPETPLLPVHFADLRQYPWPLSTSIGAPFATSKAWQEYVNQKYDGYQAGDPESKFTKPYYRDLFREAHGASLDPPMVDRRMTKRNLYNEMFYINRGNIHMIKDGRKTNDKGHDLRYWNTAFSRQHLVQADEPDKVRLVFGAPSTLLMAEQMFIWPIQAWLLSLGHKSPMLWGYETLRGGWYRLLNYFSSYFPRLDLCLCLDWSGFDRDARHTCIKDLHSKVLRPMFDFTKGYHPTKDYPDSRFDGYEPERIENLWNWTCDAVLTTPLLLPDGRMFSFNHSGIFSGYFRTQLLDTLYNMLMVFTILSRIGFDLDKIAAKFQGDDSIVLILCNFTLVSHWILNMIAHYAKIYFGATLSEKKSSVHKGLQGAEVLKYSNDNGFPTRNELEMLALLRYPERTYTYAALKARSIGIAYANAGRYTRVYKICENIFQYLDKFVEVADPHGLTHGVQYQMRYVPSSIISEGDDVSRTIDNSTYQISLERFPTYFETVCHLMDLPTPQPSKRYWNTDHFIGIPGHL